MVELLVCVFITFLIMRAHHAVKSEWQHSRDTHATQLSRDHPDWSPGRIRRNARRRARGDWLTEIGDGFPTLRQTLAEDRVLAKAVREEKLTAGEERIGKLRERVAAAIEKREVLRRGGQSESPRHVTPEPADAAVEPGTVPDAKPGRHAKPEPGAEPAAEPAPGTGPPDPVDEQGTDIVHHDHTYVLPGECDVPGCPGPFRSFGCSSCGDLIGDDGRGNPVHIGTGRAECAPSAHRNGDSPDAPIDDAVIGADREFADEDSHAPPAVPTAFMTAGELAHYRYTGKFVSGAGKDSGDWPEDNWPDDDAVPNPPSDETTDETHEKETEGDEMTTDIDGADTPYQGMQNALDAYAEQARHIETTAGDNLAAQAISHGFDRDPHLMAHLQQIQDQAAGLVMLTATTKSGLIDRHNAAEEYHGTGQDANASAFRPS